MHHGHTPTRVTAATCRVHLLSLVILLGCARVPRPVDPTAVALPLQARVDRYGTRTREPMVVQHPSGALVVAGYAVRSQALWRSRDGGAHWDSLAIADSTGAMVGNSDTDLAVAPDGTLYFASMSFDRSVSEGRRIAIGVSRDVGETWRWQVIDATRFDDRPWVKVAPDGTVHAIWNDGSGVRHMTSRDGGATWQDRPRISDAGGSSHLAIGPRGELAARIAPLSASGNRFDKAADLLRVSTDGGATWTTRTVPGRPVWSEGDLSRWVEPLAWDARGVLYAAWTEDSTVYVGRSTDQGATWTNWIIARGADAAYYPFLIARGDGDLAVTWHSGAGEGLRWHAARVDASRHRRVPIVYASIPQPLDAFAWDPRAPDKAPVRSSAGEYLAATFLRDGGLGVVTPVQSPAHDGFSWWKFR